MTTQHYITLSRARARTYTGESRSVHRLLAHHHGDELYNNTQNTASFCHLHIFLNQLLVKCAVIDSTYY